MIKEFCKVTGIKRTTAVKVGVRTLLRRPAGIEGLTKLQIEKCGALAEFVRKYTTAEYLEENTVLDSSGKSKAFCKNLFLDMQDRERMYLVLLDSQNNYITHTLVSEGTLNETAIYTRELVLAVLQNNANTVIMAHNHPGGSLKFSAQDTACARKLKGCFEALGIKLLDSIVCTPSGDCSSAAELGNL